MQKSLAILTLFFLLSGCMFIPVHKMNIEQGNVMTSDEVNRLHPGMTMSEVKEIMGPPVLLTTFADNRLSYVYTNKPAYGSFSEKSVALTFSRGRLQSIQRYGV